MGYSNFSLNLLRALNDFLTLLGLRFSQNHWGVVYDSVTKEPLDPAVVRLISVATGKVVGVCVTDMNGRYGFLAWPGRFKILVRKGNYAFPSEKVTEAEDGIYNNLYHGEFFDVVGGTDVVAFNIPMDQVNKDWNQEAKKAVINYSPYKEVILPVLTKIIFWGIFAAAIAAFVIAPTVLVKTLLAAYCFILLLAFIIPKNRLWGQILKNGTSDVLGGMILELVHPTISNVMIAKTESLADGKFFLRAPKGKYILCLKTVNGLGTEEEIKRMEVVIGREGFFNRNVYI